MEAHHQEHHLTATTLGREESCRDTAQLATSILELDLNRPTLTVITSQEEPTILSTSLSSNNQLTATMALEEVEQQEMAKVVALVGTQLTTTGDKAVNQLAEDLSSHHLSASKVQETITLARMTSLIIKKIMSPLTTIISSVMRTWQIHL